MICRLVLHVFCDSHFSYKYKPIKIDQFNLWANPVRAETPTQIYLTHY